MKDLLTDMQVFRAAEHLCLRCGNYDDWTEDGHCLCRQCMVVEGEAEGHLYRGGETGGRGGEPMRLKELIKKYKEIGKMTLTGDRKKNHNSMMEYQRYGDMILEEVCRMYEAGELDVIGADR